MNNFWLNVLVNVIIFFVVFIGFFIFYGKSHNWFKEGGLIYEWWKNKRASIKEKRKKRNN